MAKNITHFTIQFRSKNLTHFTNINSFDIKNNMLPQHSQKPFWLTHSFWLTLSLHIFLQTCFRLLSEKTFALHHYSTPKKFITEALWKQMSVYFYISPQEIFYSKDLVRFYLMRVGLGVWGRLNYFLKAARCLCLVKCFTIFHFNWSFDWNSAFWYFHL